MIHVYKHSYQIMLVRLYYMCQNIGWQYITMVSIGWWSCVHFMTVNSMKLHIGIKYIITFQKCLCILLNRSNSTIKRSLGSPCNAILIWERLFWHLQLNKRPGVHKKEHYWLNMMVFHVQILQLLLLRWDLGLV